MASNRELLTRANAYAAQLAEREANDPLRSFQPSPKQEAFITSILAEQCLENWMIAANRSGKSVAGSFCGATLARFGNDNARYVRAHGSSISVRDRSVSLWVSALDFNTSRDVIQPKYFDNGFVPPGASHPPFIPPHEVAEWRTNDQILKLKNGSIIGFKSCDSGRGKYQGAEKDAIHFDEEHPYPVYEEAIIRVGARPLKIFGTVTLLPPEGTVGGVSWMYPRMIDPWIKGELEHVRLFTASIYDNPHIPVTEIARLESKYPPGSVERRIRLEGEWLPGLSGARAYGGFSRLVHVRPQPPPDPYRPLCWCMDFNVEPMITLVGQRVGSMFRVMRELVLDQADIMTMVEMFYHAFPHHGSEVYIYGDATSRGRSRQTGQSDYQLVINGMRQYAAPTRLKVPELNPPVPDRINAVNRICRDESGMVRLQIDPSCEELIADLEQVVRDPKGGIKKTSNVRDPYYRRTHASDALGYWINYEEPVRSRAIGEKRSISIPLPTYGLQAKMERFTTGRVFRR